MGSGVSVQRTPEELIINILLRLHREDVLSISYANKRLNNLVRNFVALQLRISLEESRYIGCNDAKCTTLPTTERLAMLKHHNSTWSGCRFLASRTPLEISIPDAHTWISNYQRSFSQGLYIFKEPLPVRLNRGGPETMYIYKITPIANYIRDADPVSMEARDRGCSSIVPLPSVRCRSTIRGYAVDHHGQDLIALATVEWGNVAEGSGQVSIFLHFRHLSSGLPHSKSIHEILPVIEETYSNLDPIALVGLRFSQVCLEIIDEYILMYLHTFAVGIPGSSVANNRLVLVNWMSGTVVACDVTSNRVWSGFTCLSRNIILLTNHRMQTLDIVRLPIPAKGFSHNERSLEPDPGQTKAHFTMLLRLRLPDCVLLDLNSFSPVTCSSASKPFADHSVHIPFTPSPDSALVRVRLTAINDGSDSPQLKCGFFVHRESLLSLLANTNFVSVVEAAKPGPLLQSILERENDRNHGDGRTNSGPSTVEWDEWGPDITCWTGGRPEVLRGRLALYGERAIWVDRGTDELVVWDFNPVRVKNAAVTLSRLQTSTEAQPVNSQVKRRTIIHSEINSTLHFKSNIYARLPYLETRHPFVANAPDLAMHMDAEHLLVERIENLTEQILNFQGDLDVYSFM